MKFLYGTARAFSNIFSPLLMATYGVALAMTLSFLCLIPLDIRLTVIAETFLVTAAIPIIAIFLLYKFHVITDPKLNDRTDRTWPYIIEIACFLGLAVYFYFIKAPLWLSLFLMGGAVALIILTIINRWWKISGHATGMGALCGMVFYLMVSGNSLYNLQWPFIFVCLLAGCVCTSRLILERHTLGQVAAGFITGFTCVFLAAYLLQATPMPIPVK